MTLSKTPIFGLPLNPMPLLEQLAGASFCVSYATRDKLGRQLDDAIRLVGDDGILLVDNGAFSLHKQGVSAREESYLEGFETWAQDILDRCPQAIAVIPDVIGGSEEENAELVRTTLLDTDRAMPIWHMHESLDYLLYLCEGFEYVGIGSSGDFWQCGSPVWQARIAEAFAAIEAWEASSNGAYIRPRLHMMRAQSQAHLYAFDSADSTNVAMNHGRYRAEGEGHVERFAARASAKIAASSGPEAEHQVKRPLLGHLKIAAQRARWEALWAQDRADVIAERQGELVLVEAKACDTTPHASLPHGARPHGTERLYECLPCGGRETFGATDMTRKYFTLVSQEPGQDWAPLFGDFDREVVAQEMADTRESFDFVRRTMLRIIVSAADQASIDAAVADLNAPRVRHFSMSARTAENPLGEY